MDFFRPHLVPLRRAGQVLWRLPQKPNGDCQFLDRKTGCTIYEKRPAICKAYDCAAQVLAQKYRGFGTDKIPKPILKAARKLLKGGYVPDTWQWRAQHMRQNLL